MIIIDTNILIDWFHGLVPNIYEVLQHNDVAICGVVQSEFLCGARSDAEIAWMRELVDALTYIDVSRSDWEHIGFFLRTLREHCFALLRRYCEFCAILFSTQAKLGGFSHVSPSP